LLIAKRKEASNLRRPKKVPPITQDEQWASTPTGWAWTRWDYITDWITYGFTRPMEHHPSGIPIVTGKNVINGKIDYSTAHFASRVAFDSLNDKDKPQPGDVLITKDGSIGRTAVVREDHGDFCINQSVAVLWLRSCHLSREYIQLVLDCPQTQQELQARTAGVAIKHISITDLGKMVWPVPPLAEQHRIVAKVEELMSLCDRLERALQDATTTRARLLEATLREALEGA
jgi:type I restriction enzyme, S subunit